MKNEKAAGPSGVVSEIVRGGEEGADMITELANQIIVEGAIQVMRTYETLIGPGGSPADKGEIGSP